MPQVAHELLTLAAYARHRGCSRPAVSKALREKRITLTAEGLIDPVAADAQWQARTRPRATAKPAAAELPLSADAAGVSYQEAKRRQAVADMLQAERLEAEQRGELLRREVMERVVGDLAAALKQRVMQVKARLAPLLAAETDVAKVSAMLDAELRAALEASASNGQQAGEVAP